MNRTKWVSFCMAANGGRELLPQESSSRVPASIRLHSEDTLVCPVLTAEG